MADDELDTQHGSAVPRSREEQAFTGSGTPRSADTGTPNEGAFADGGVDPAVVTGATSSSHPAESNELNINRSGSGMGSGGPVDRDDELEGSSGQSLSELLTGDDASLADRGRADS